MIMDGAAELFLAPSKTHSHHLTDPTSFPTIHPNPVVIQQASGTGFKTLWVVFALMTIATLVFAVWSLAVPPSKRLFHSLTATIVLIATLSYFAMATGQGVSFIHLRIREKHDHGIPDTFKYIERQVFWARYADWLFTTPLLLVDLGLLAGLNGSDIFSIIVADIVMIVTGLFASLSEDRKTGWTWWVFGTISFIWILYVLIVNGISSAKAKGAKVQRFFTLIGGYTIILWTAYPIIWAITSGTLRLSVNAEIVAYAVLDVLAKGVFGAWLLFTHKALPEAQLTVGGFWAHGYNNEGTLRVGDDEEGA